MTNEEEIKLKSLLKNAEAESRKLRLLSREIKDNVLNDLIELIKKNEHLIIEENKKDISSFKKSDQFTSALYDRLELNPKRINSMIESLNQVSSYKDPVGLICDQRILKNGLKLELVQDSFGLIFFIFESRPNVVTEAFSLAFKSGNVLIAKNGKEASSTCEILYDLILQALYKNNLSQFNFIGLPRLTREETLWMLRQDQYLDLVIPRGGDGLIRMVKRESMVPVIQNDRGLCHLYVDEEAQTGMAVELVINAKLQRPSVCNSIETLLLHEKKAIEFIEAFNQRITNHNQKLELRVCPRFNLLKNRLTSPALNIKVATEQDFHTEHLDFILNCKIVSDIQESLDHIYEHGSGHSECIVTENQNSGHRFQKEVDAAAVYWNASTRFTDGFEFGLGGEIGISTQKLHVRGPVGLNALTTKRWVIKGKGQIRE